MTRTHHLTHPPYLLHPRLIASGAALLMAAFVTDLLYWRTLSSQWETFSVWLLTGGLILAALSGLALLLDRWLRRADGDRLVAVRGLGCRGFALAAQRLRPQPRRLYRRGPSRPRAVGLVTVLLLVVGWRGWSLPRRASSTRFISIRECTFMTAILFARAARSPASWRSPPAARSVAPPSTQYGANPELPAPQQYIVPPMRSPRAVGWGSGQTPVVPAGLQVRAFATGFMHPRMVYTLPNGDVLVVETNGPHGADQPAQGLCDGQVQGLWRLGRAGRQPHHPAARRQRRRQARPPHRLHRPSELAVRRRAGRRSSSMSPTPTPSCAFPMCPGETRITAPGVRLTDLPAGPINHHWTKSLTASPDGSKLYVGVGSNSNITENGIEAEDGRAAIWEVDRATGLKRIFASGMRNPTGRRVRAADRQAVGDRQRARRDRPEPRAGLSDLGRAERLLWLALQLLRPASWTFACSPQRPGPGRQGDLARLRAELARRAARHGLQPGHQPAGALSQRRLRQRAWQLGSRSAQRLQGGLCALPGRPPQRAAAGRRHRLPHARRTGARAARSASRSIARARC